MRAVWVCLSSLAVVGCGQVDRAGECARAVDLHLQAIERQERVASRGEGSVTADDANKGVVAAARYRYLACEHDSYQRVR